MNQTPSPPPKRPSGTRTFLRGFNVEDLILYVFSLLMLVLFALFFYQRNAAIGEMQSTKPFVDAWLEPSGNDICLDYLKAQVTNVALRYNQAQIATSTNSVRRSLAFLIGTIGFMLGCIIVIRGVRNVPIEAELSAENKARIRLITSSPGIVIVVLSTIIIMSVVLLNDKVEVRDDGIKMPTCSSVVPASDSEYLNTP